MLIPTLILGVLAVILLYLGYRRGEGQHLIGLKSSVTMTIEVLPLLIFAFVVAGLIAQSLFPHTR
jgi:hypothetical protein